MSAAKKKKSNNTNNNAKDKNEKVLNTENQEVKRNDNLKISKDTSQKSDNSANFSKNEKSKKIKLENKSDDSQKNIQKDIIKENEKVDSNNNKNIEKKKKVKSEKQNEKNKQEENKTEKNSEIKNNKINNDESNNDKLNKANNDKISKDKLNKNKTNNNELNNNKTHENKAKNNELKNKKINKNKFKNDELNNDKINENKTKNNELKNKKINKNKLKNDELNTDKINENKINNNEINNNKTNENKTKNNELKNKKTNKNKLKNDELNNKINNDKLNNNSKINNKKKNKKENKKEVKKDLILVKETPDYVKEMLNKKKKKMYITVTILVIIVLLILFSTIFAILNIKNSNFNKGVKVRNIDISNLSVEDASNKINKYVETTLAPEINLKYSDSYNISLKPEQIEFKYQVKDALTKAYEIGRNGNIIQNNYTLLFTIFLGNNVDLEYTYNEELLENFIDDVNSKIPGLVVHPSYYIEETQLFINKGTDGIQVKKDELKNAIIEAITKRTAEETSNPEFKQILEIPTEKVNADKIDVEKIYNEVKRDPQDAYFETDPYKIYPDIDGVDFNISIEEAKNIINSEQKEEYIIPLKITKANKTINDLGTEAFPYLVSSFSTKYDASNRNRSTNLEIAANKINGKVLMPGEVFSFNKVVGKRTVEEGYKDAKIYADGGVVDGLAGGICQISSTLYNAVLLANLEIVERRNHSFPTSYVRTGRDATVVYGKIDFQFKNSRTYPIKIEATVKNGIAEFKMHGMQEENEYEIKIIPVTTQSIPYSTNYIPDATLVPGQQIVVQSGQPGYKVTTYIEKSLNGEVVSKDILSNDTYSPMKTIIRVGPGVPIQ